MRIRTAAGELSYAAALAVVLCAAAVAFVVLQLIEALWRVAVVIKMYVRRCRSKFLMLSGR